MKVTKTQIGNKTHLTVESNFNQDLFCQYIDAIRDSYSLGDVRLTMAEVSKLFGFEGTTQDGRNFGRKLSGTREVTFAEFELAERLATEK